MSARFTLALATAVAVTVAPVMAASPYPLVGRGDRYSGENFATRSPVIARHGMAATAQPLASQVGIDILKQGGSAIDAAIAVNAMLGLVEPVSCGIGGDLFVLLWDPKANQVVGYNGSGRSPKGRSFNDMKKKLNGREGIPPRGSLSVTVPGAVDGWFALHEKYGKLPMEKVLAPAIAYAKEGFPVSQLVALYLANNFRAFGNDALIEEKENAKKTYLIDGRVPKEGDIFRNPDLARTYEMLAKGGRDAFYKGDVARTMDAYFKRVGGDLRYEDFAAHKGEWIKPLSVSYRGTQVYAMPPNSQGAATLQMLKIMDGFDAKAMGAGSADLFHMMIETKRLVFEDLARYYADPAFSKVPMDWLLSDNYAKQRRAMIRMDRVAPNVKPGEAKLAQGDTTYFTTADSDGMMVSWIQSNYRGMGSGLVADGLGFMFQDRGELYSLEAGHPNVYAPGKRPFQTIIPGFVTKDGKPWLAYGVMGGDMQPQGHVQVLSDMIDFGMNVQEAGDAARWRHVGARDAGGAEVKESVQLESGVSPAVRAELQKRGHVLSESNGSYGGYQAIMRDPLTGAYWGGSEMRKDGAAIGY
jgi:gamma-glutamyltranspeptidase/glutathione hydrolase